MWSFLVGRREGLERTWARPAVKLADASILLVASTTYLCYVFQLLTPAFWSAGLGDWGDPYFINYLLEHWHHSVWTLADPSSPPMFFPAPKTLGYSHGLILYVPFYLPVRQVLNAFQAYNLMLVFVLETGIVCLYVIVRRVFGLSLVESLLLTAFFVSSPNVINGATAVWSQRASVFLIPPILLMLVVSRRLSGLPRLALTAISGLLATLLYAQDFYTAHFAFTFAILFVAAALPGGSLQVVRERVTAFWKSERPRAKVASRAAALAAAWTSYLWICRRCGGAVAWHASPVARLAPTSLACGRVPGRVRRPAWWNPCRSASRALDDLAARAGVGWRHGQRRVPLDLLGSLSRASGVSGTATC